MYLKMEIKIKATFEKSQIINYKLILELNGREVHFLVEEGIDKYGADIRWYIEEGSIDHLSDHDIELLDEYIKEMRWLYE